MAAALVLVAVLGGLVWLVFFAGEPEPVYQGKRLSAWLEDLSPTSIVSHPAEFQIATNAVRHIGTNAIPTLLRMLQARDSALTLKLVALAEQQRVVKIHYVRASERNLQAVSGFGTLGAKAKDAVPPLMKIYQQNNSPVTRRFAAAALCAIGPDARAAVRLFLREAIDTNTGDQNARDVRYACIYALGRVHAEPELVVPALATALSDPDRFVRMNAGEALGKFGPDAKAAVPALFGLLNDQDSAVREAAALAIKKIDPEGAAVRKAELDAALAPENK